MGCGVRVSLTSIPSICITTVLYSSELPAATLGFGSFSKVPNRSYLSSSLVVFVGF